MKKYQHKKNKIVVEYDKVNDCYSFTYRNTSGDPETGFIDKFFVEDCDDWKELNEPKFVTKDGKEMYYDDVYYYFDKNDYIHIGTVKENNIFTGLTFSTKEKAYEWRYNNDKRFSIENIREAIHNSTSSTNPLVCSKSHLLKKLGIEK